MPEEAAHPAKRPGRLRRYAVFGALVSFLLVFGALSTIPEYILFRERLLFSIFDLDSELTLHPFDQDTHDGLVLRSWFHPPEEDRLTLVYFAGREGDLIHKPAHLLRLAQEGYGLLLVGYRGYGGNPGWPNEQAMFRDAAGLLSQGEAAGLAPNGYVLYGYSMGSGVATNVAVQVDPRALILEAPLSNFFDAVRQQAANVPRWLVRTRFDNLSSIARLDIPVLLLAGGADSITPAWFALALAAANPVFATVHVLDGANHFNIIRLGGRALIADFLEELEELEELEAGPAAEPPAMSVMPESSASAASFAPLAAFWALPEQSARTAIPSDVANFREMRR